MIYPQEMSFELEESFTEILMIGEVALESET